MYPSLQATPLIRPGFLVSKGGLIRRGPLYSFDTLVTKSDNCPEKRKLLTKSSEDNTEDEAEEDEGRVPHVVVIDGGHAKEHEDDGLTQRCQHLHEVLDGRVRLSRDVHFYVLFHYDAAEYTPGM